MRKIEPSDLKRRGALYRIEFNPHILCYYKKYTRQAPSLPQRKTGVFHRNAHSESDEGRANTQAKPPAGKARP
ncbi:MAG: hypothetical protein OXH59_18970 [Rhodospirillaceae bacterium]|nr:hypothetical protein [Rhodospirillaceae bacterium]